MIDLIKSNLNEKKVFLTYEDLKQIEINNNIKFIKFNENFISNKYSTIENNKIVKNI